VYPQRARCLIGRMTDEELDAYIAESAELIATHKANGRVTRS
jgi:hypothetical protein